MIVLNQLAMSHGSKILFTDVNLNLNKNKRYGLVGANGTGKSTLLQLITGAEQPSEGSVAIPKSETVGWLKQDQFKYENDRIIDVVIQGKPKLWAALSTKEELLTDPDLELNYTEELGYQLAELEETIAHYGGYTAETDAINMLNGLGIPKSHHHLPMNTLSGGYKLRVLLAQTLFSNPDILLLDEPTNHLDILSITWLEKYLKNEYIGLLLFITHDIEFINKLADYILDIDYGEIRLYNGDYAKFLLEKQNIAEQKLHEKKHLEEKITQLQLFVDKFKAKASKARQAQSKQKQIDRIELPDVKQSSRIAPNFVFTIKHKSAKKVLDVKNLGKKYGNKVIFNNLNFTIRQSERVAIIGANGIGKSTLLKTLLNKLPSHDSHYTGEYTWGEQTEISYFSQDHHDLLIEHQSVLNWLNEHSTKSTSQDVRKMLGRVLFTKDEVDKDIQVISGGEAARLLLARIMLNTGNVLILDEPTNHMDLESIDNLSKALTNYNGTLLLVSHNRDLIRATANRIIYIDHDGITDFKGSYNEFCALLED